MKINKYGFNFDSDIEVLYYEKLMADSEVLDFVYHPKHKIAITDKNNYTPDFVVLYKNGYAEIIETKGYNPYSKLRDDLIHSKMLAMSKSELMAYCQNVLLREIKNATYKKIKHLKAYGFVDWDFKNPNTLSNQRAKARDEAKSSLKQALQELKEYKRYYSYMESTKKLTKAQNEWLEKFRKENNNDKGI